MQRSRWHPAAPTTLLAIALVFSACSSAATPSPTQAPSAPAPTQALSAPATPTKAAAAATSPAPAAANESATVTVGVDQEAKTLDPALSTDLYSAQLFYQIFNPLVYVDFEGGIKPGLAKSWKVSADGLTIDFTLADNVTWHDGSKLTAEDVVFSLQRVMDPQVKSPSAARLKIVDSLKAVDASHVQVKLKNPSAPFFYDLTLMPITPKAAVEKLGKDFGKTPVGSGPFKFVSWLEGDRITLERFDQHFAGAPKFAKLVFRVIPEASVRLMELETGGVDVITGVPGDQVANIESKPNLAVSKVTGTNFRALAMNMTKPPFDNRLVRQAIAAAIDREKIVNMVYHGLAVPAYGPFSPGTFAYDPSFKGITYDPQKAKKLLADAGLAKGFESEILVPQGDNETKEAALYVEQLAAIGVTARVKTLDFATTLDAMSKANYQIGRMPWTPPADPHGFVSVAFTSDSLSSYNFSKYSNPKVDDLVSKGAATMDQAQRTAIYRELQQILVDDAPAAFVFHEMRAAGYNKKIAGFRIHPAGLLYFKTPYGVEVSVTK